MVKEIKVNNANFVDVYWYGQDEMENVIDGSVGDLVLFREYENKRFTGYFKAMRISDMKDGKLILEEYNEELD